MDKLPEKSDGPNISADKNTQPDRQPDDSHLSTSSSPVSKSRYGRTCKPKISNDFYHIDDIFETPKSKRQSVSPKSSSLKDRKPKETFPVTSKSTPKAKLKQKPSHSFSKSATFLHITGDTDFSTFEHEKILEKTKIYDSAVAKNTNKFFKRAKNKTLSSTHSNKKIMQSPSSSRSEKSKYERKSDTLQQTTSSSSSILEANELSSEASETEKFGENLSLDLSKVLKIVSSKSPILENINFDTRVTTKPAIKTYINKRKYTPKADIIESFALPDLPIFPVGDGVSSSKQKVIKEIDLENTNCENDVNIIDKKLLNRPWDIGLDTDEFNSSNENITEFEHIKAEEIDLDIKLFDAGADKSEPLELKNKVCGSQPDNEHNTNKEVTKHKSETEKLKKKEINKFVEDKSSFINKDTPNRIPEKRRLSKNERKHRKTRITLAEHLRSQAFQKTESTSKPVIELNNKVPQQQKVKDKNEKEPVISPDKETKDKTNKSHVNDKKKNVKVIKKDTEKVVDVITNNLKEISRSKVDDNNLKTIKEPIKDRSITIKQNKLKRSTRGVNKFYEDEELEFLETDNQNKVKHKEEGKISLASTCTKTLQKRASSKSPIKKYGTDTACEITKKSKDIASTRTEISAVDPGIINKENKTNQTEKLQKGVTTGEATLSSENRRKKLRTTKVDTNNLQKRESKSATEEKTTIENNDENILSNDMKASLQNEHSKQQDVVQDRSPRKPVIRRSNSPRKAQSPLKKSQFENIMQASVNKSPSKYKTGAEDAVVKGPTFKVGDLIWSKIGSHPFWPSIICKDLETGDFKKTIFQKRERILYHVKFFGDKGRHSWISKYHIMQYKTKNDLQVLFKKLKPKMKSNLKYLCQAYKVSSVVLPKWQNAVEEIESIKSKSVRERLSFFESVVDESFEIPEEEIKEEDEANRKQRASVDSVTSDVQNHKSQSVNECVSEKSKENRRENTPVIEKPKTRNSMLLENLCFNNFVAKNIKTLKESRPDLDEKSIENHLKELWNNLSSKEKKLYGFTNDVTSEYSDSDTHSSSKASTSSGIPTSMEEQIKLYKRNSLFKGVSRDRVCHYCETPNNILKCKGPCNGLYHPTCAKNLNLSSKLHIETISGLNKSYVAKNQSDVSSTSSAGKVTSVENEGDTVFNPNIEIKIEKDDEPSEYDFLTNDKYLDDSRVEIISIYSDDSDMDCSELSSIDLSSRKLTLFEQIDLKMKEVMGKFEDKPVHADSTTDLNPDDNIASFSENVESKNKKKIEQTADEDTDSKSSEDTINKQDTAVSSASESTTKPDEQETGTTEVDCDQFRCCYCSVGEDPPCFVCGLITSAKGDSIRQRCSLYQCGKFYHPDCLKIWPQTQWSLINSSKSKKTEKRFDSFVCPSHVCHTCVSDDPRVAISRCSSDKVVKCLRCPATYHTSNFCIPAGTVILSSSQILCPRHRKKKSRHAKGNRHTQTINTTWCFICSKGGNLICCETCPTSVHPDCLKVNLMDDGTFICEDCESGRFPLYDEIVWVKLGNFRWWPSVILFPNEVPDNINNLPHEMGDFVVRFFGSHDHYWVNRGRVFLFQDGDQGGHSQQRRKIDRLFNKALDEAVTAYELKKEFKLKKESEIKNGTKPPPYIKIKVNKPVGNVKQVDCNISNTTACECDPQQPFPCGPDSDCINRLLLTECNPEICPAGDRCYNQRFEKRQYPPLEPYKTEARGWGLRSLAPIRKGDFVIEYVGEIIDETEYQRRVNRMHETKDENYYFLTIDKDRVIDAGPKGNLARFMNHCCQPNCETQKWTVNGDTRVGLFAMEDIPANTELTFNYNLECIGKEKKVCKCGAPNCTGFIGVKFKSENIKKLKKKESINRKKSLSSPVSAPSNDSLCFVCGKAGEVRGCCYKVCNKFYHLKCVSLKFWPEGNKWVCPSHNCNSCGKRTIRCCYKCTNSYCPTHAEGNIRYDNMLGFVCSEHDPSKASQDKPLQSLSQRKKSRFTSTKETDITSTTDDVIESLLSKEDEEKWENDNEKEYFLEEKIISSAVSSKGGKLLSLKDDPIEMNSDFTESNTVTSTPVKRQKLSDLESETRKKPAKAASGKKIISSPGFSKSSLSESSEYASDSKESNKRKRGRPRREMQTSKRMKLEEVVRPKRNLSVPNLLDNISVQNEVKLSPTIPARHLRTVRSSFSNSTSEKFLRHQSEMEKDLPIRKRTRPRCETSGEIA